MFAPHCPSCDRRVLLGHDRIERLEGALSHDGRRHEVTLRCRCGSRVRWSAAPALTSP